MSLLWIINEFSSCYTLSHDSYLDDTISFLLGSLKTTRDKTSTFQAIGLLAISVQDNIVRYLPGILEVVRASLPPKDLPAKYVSRKFFLLSL